jgi:hypothetical protein
MSDNAELPRLRREMDELFDRMDARFERIDTMLTECCAAINLLIEQRPQRDAATAETPDDPWERAGATQRVAVDIAAVVAHACEGDLDDETILAQLQDAADALRERLT